MGVQTFNPKSPATTAQLPAAILAVALQQAEMQGFFDELLNFVQMNKAPVTQDLREGLDEAKPWLNEEGKPLKFGAASGLKLYTDRGALSPKQTDTIYNYRAKIGDGRNAGFEINAILLRCNNDLWGVFSEVTVSQLGPAQSNDTRYPTPGSSLRNG
jgi:hypothetical protein